VEVLKGVGVEVIGMVSIFTYDFPVAAEAFSRAGLTYQPLTNYSVLIQLAIEKGIVLPDQQEILLKWRNDPANWEGVL
jgi:orotate phosphoribosyltransferase